MKKIVLCSLLFLTAPALAQTVVFPPQQGYPYPGSSPGSSYPPSSYPPSSYPPSSYPGSTQQGKVMTTQEFAQKALEDAQKASENQAQAQQDQSALGQPPNSQVGAIPLGSPGSQELTAQENMKRPPSDDEMREERRLLWSFDPSQELRQSGGRLERATNNGFYYSQASSDRNLLDRWIAQLKNEGFAEDKIIFEAKRLTKNDFERWASRLLWSEQELHPNFTQANY